MLCKYENKKDVAKRSSLKINSKYLFDENFDYQ